MGQRRNKDTAGDLSNVLLDRLREAGIDLKTLCGDLASVGEEGERQPLKVICVAADLRSSVAELGQATRDQVVMVRVDDETARSLDAWIEAGAVRSRSAAAALFIREGLNVRAHELEQLGEALRDIEDAKQRLRDKAREVLGDQLEEA